MTLSPTPCNPLTLPSLFSHCIPHLFCLLTFESACSIFVCSVPVARINKCVYETVAKKA